MKKAILTFLIITVAFTAVEWALFASPFRPFEMTIWRVCHYHETANKTNSFIHVQYIANSSGRFPLEFKCGDHSLIGWEAE